jgi:hypothetical protein
MLGMIDQNICKDGAHHRFSPGVITMDLNGISLTEGISLSTIKRQQMQNMQIIFNVSGGLHAKSR